MALGYGSWARRRRWCLDVDPLITMRPCRSLSRLPLLSWHQARSLVPVLGAADASILVDLDHSLQLPALIVRRCFDVLHRPPGPSQVVVRREPSRVAFISIVRRSTFRAELRTFQPRKGGYASASNFPELCDSDGLQHHPSKFRVFARVSGNVGTTNGLHARRLAAVRRASPRCGQDRGLLTAKYPATQRTVPRGF